MDHCFEQILDTIQKLDAVKDQYLEVLFDTCMDAANILIGNCAVNSKPINGFVNKMFKMSDKYMAEHNKIPGVKPLSRVRINLSFEAFRKRKEAVKGPDKAPPVQA